MLQEMLEIEEMIKHEECNLGANNKYLKRPEEGKKFFDFIIQKTKIENKEIKQNIKKLRKEYNKLLKELILNEADFDMIFDIFEDDIEEYVTENCKKRYTQKEMYL